jgi:hypothetical protein
MRPNKFIDGHAHRHQSLDGERFNLLPGQGSPESKVRPVIHGRVVLLE